MIKLRGCTSESSEHGFGNLKTMCRCRDFSCSDFASMSEQELRMFKHDLQPTGETQMGCSATYNNWIESLKALCDILVSGPCEIDIYDNVLQVSQ